VPEWYYLPFYAILRSIPNKLAGVTAMFSGDPGAGIPALARYREKPSPSSIEVMPGATSGIAIILETEDNEMMRPYQVVCPSIDQDATLFA